MCKTIPKSHLHYNSVHILQPFPCVKQYICHIYIIFYTRFTNLSLCKSTHKSHLQVYTHFTTRPLCKTILKSHLQTKSTQTKLQAHESENWTLLNLQVIYNVLIWKMICRCMLTLFNLEVDSLYGFISPQIKGLRDSAFLESSVRSGNQSSRQYFPLSFGSNIF